MDIKTIWSKTDHTLLKTNATWEQIRRLMDAGIRCSAASVCIPPRFVKQAAEYAAGRIPVCTVIGFPNGYQTGKIKCLEAAEAVRNGADEIDMVICIGDVKAKRYDAVLQEINEVKAACDGKLLKVIVETCALTSEEKDRICEIVDESDADFIKTSTGFAEKGAQEEDIRRWKSMIHCGTKIKAAGGIRTPEDAARFLEAGADRIGASSLIPDETEERSVQ